MNRKRLLQRVARSQNNVAFRDFVDLIEGFGYRLSRGRGSHLVFVHPNVREYLNVQERRGEVKPYQVRQLLAYVEKYNLALED